MVAILLPSVMGSEREVNHWFKIEHKLNRVKNAWDDVVDEENDDYFSFGGKLNGKVEKVCNASLILAGLCATLR